MRRRWVRTSGLIALIATAAVCGDGVSGARPGLAAATKWETRRDAPTDRTARRRWALARMDEMARERQRCRDRFKVARQIAECEVDFGRRFREYNEVYLEAARE